MGLGIPEIIIVGIFVPPFIGLLLIWPFFRRRAKRFGYASTGDYLRAAPRSDLEKQDAVDVTLKGLVVCGLGLLFPPFILVGLIPLFYGGRKVVYASMGLGLVDDGDRTGA